MFDKRRNFKKRFPRCPNGLSPSQRQRGNLTRVSGEASADKPRGNLFFLSLPYCHTRRKNRRVALCKPRRISDKIFTSDIINP